MGELSFIDHLEKVREEFNRELYFLFSKQTLTKLDVEKIRAQAEIYKNALITTYEERSFSDKAKDKLLTTLVQDFEKSIQKTLDEAMSRKDDKSLLIYRLNKVDRKIELKIRQMDISQSEAEKIQIGMELLKSYIILTLPKEKNLLGSFKIDIGYLAANYEKTLLIYFENNHLPLKSME